MAVESASYAEPRMKYCFVLEITLLFSTSPWQQANPMFPTTRFDKRNAIDSQSSPRWTNCCVPARMDICVEKSNHLRGWNSCRNKVIWKKVPASSHKPESSVEGPRATNEAFSYASIWSMPSSDFQTKVRGSNDGNSLWEVRSRRPLELWVMREISMS